MNSERLTTILLGFILIIVIGITTKQCEKNKDLVDDIGTMKNFEKEAKFYEGKNGELVAYNNTLEVSLEALKVERQGLYDSIKSMSLKKPKTVVVTKTEIEVDSIYIPFTEKLPCDSFMVVFQHNDSVWFQVKGRVSQSGVFIESVNMENKTLTVLGTKKNGIFKRNEFVVAITNTNPYINVKTIEPIVIKQKPAFYDRLWFKGLIFVGGVATGVAVAR